MSDLIRKQDAIEALWKALYTYEAKTEKQFQDSDELDITDWIQHRIFVQNMNDIDRQTILDLPSAEPERKKGKWIDGMLYHDFDESEWEKVKCSVCENFVTKQIFYHDNKYHYCPYCGADMRGE